VTGIAIGDGTLLVMNRAAANALAE
jgi:hypothetical protein